MKAVNRIAVNRIVVNHLVELFYHLADAVDSGEKLPDHVWEAYETAFKDPDVKKFYADSVSQTAVV